MGSGRGRRPAAAPVAWLVVALALALPFAVPPAAAEPVAVTATPVALDPAAPARTTLGPLLYRGGLELRAADRRFGGFSGLMVDADDRLTAVADVGEWMRARLLSDADGRLVGITDVHLEPLRDAAGRPFADKVWGDAEALTLLADGSLLVGFESRHRMLRYARVGAEGQPFAAPPGLDGAPDNAGIEALTRLGDGRLLAVTEDFRTGDGGAVVGWIGPAPWRPLSLETSEGFLPTALTALPGGDVLLVERRFPFLAIRLRRIPRATIVADARLRPVEIARFEGSLSFDNFEGASAVRDDRGNTVLHLISDDNQFALQRTLLLRFILAED